MTKEEAKEWAIKKWQYIVDNNGSSMGISKAIPKLEEFINVCSYCELYFYISNEIFEYCVGCPLIVESENYDYGNSGCGQKNSLYDIWYKDSTKENAQKVLDLIINT
jgi:hypothetical protein